MERLKNTFWGITVTTLLACPINSMFAQTHSEKELIPEEIRKISANRKLVADVVNTKMETAAIDSIQMQYEFEEEEEMSPSDELYDGMWNNQYVKAYSDVAIPDTFHIDLSSFVMPVNGKITSPFGPRRRRFHYGTDLKLQVGDVVVAAFEGKVRVKQYEKHGYGYYLVLRHPNGLETVYGHLSDFLVEEGQTVEAGQPIALGGNTGRSTGPHLHFECRFVGHAIDPAEIVDFDNYCTFEDSYIFRKSKINEISSNNYRYTAKQHTPHNRRSSITYHRIRIGDSLSKIAQKHKISIPQLCRLNGVKPTSILKVGKVLRTS